MNLSDGHEERRSIPSYLLDDNDMSRDGMVFINGRCYVWFISADLFLLNFVVYEQVEFSISGGKSALPTRTPKRRW